MVMISVFLCVCSQWYEELMSEVMNNATVGFFQKHVSKYKVCVRSSGGSRHVYSRILSDCTYLLS